MASGFSNCGSQVLEHRLNSCVPWAYLLHCIWNLPESGIKLMSPTLAGRFFITEPPEKPRATVINICKHVCLCFKYKYSDGNKSDLSFFQVSHAWTSLFPITLWHRLTKQSFYIKIGKHLQVAKWLQPATWLKNNKFSSLILYNALNKFTMLQNGYPRIQMLTVEENLEALSNIFPSYIPTQYTHPHTYIHTLLFKV